LDTLNFISRLFLAKRLSGDQQKPGDLPEDPENGLPALLHPGIGYFQNISVIALIQPKFNRLKEWAFAGFAFDVVFAFISALAIESYGDCIKSGVAFGIVILTYVLFLKKQHAAIH
jgi:hypothetical protein